jgi:uncharacterized protein HemX
MEFRFFPGTKGDRIKHKQRGMCMICKNCGYENDDQVKFCVNCGEYLYDDPEEETEKETAPEPEKEEKTEEKAPENKGNDKKSKRFLKREKKKAKKEKKTGGITFWQSLKRIMIAVFITVIVCFGCGIYYFYNQKQSNAKELAELQEENKDQAKEIKRLKKELKQAQKDKEDALVNEKLAERDKKQAQEALDDAEAELEALQDDSDDSSSSSSSTSNNTSS